MYRETFSLVPPSGQTTLTRYAFHARPINADKESAVIRETENLAETLGVYHIFSPTLLECPSKTRSIDQDPSPDGRANRCH